MDMMELQQLSVHPNQNGVTKENIKAPHARFNKLILDLAIAKPLWNFEVTRVRSYEKTVQMVKVYQHGEELDRKSTRLNSSHVSESRMPSSA